MTPLNAATKAVYHQLMISPLPLNISNERVEALARRIAKEAIAAHKRAAEELCESPREIRDRVNDFSKD